MVKQNKSYILRNMKKFFYQTKPIQSSSSLSSNWLSSGRNKCFNENDGFEGIFREAIWPFLVIGQFFGVMPLIGVKSHQISELKFKWKSFRTLYSLIIAFILTSYSLLLVWETFSMNIDFSSIAYLIFYGTNTYGFLSFFFLAQKFPQLMRYWENAETKLPTFSNQKQKKNFIRKIWLLSLTILFLALIEHSLSVGSMIHFNVVCQSEKDPITELVKSDVPYLFSYVEKMTIWEAICVKIISFSATFVWNFLDVFIILISIGLSTHFKLYNYELKQAKNEHMSQEFWVYQRAQYGRLCDLVRLIDKRITHMILLCFFNDLFFICKQLFSSLRPHPTYYRMIYFWYSLIFLIMRAFLVSFSAAGINDESMEPIRILRSIPSYSWNTETKRFFDEVINDTVALSGMKFFYLTRKLILSVAGSIVTYELVLAQFQLSYNQAATCKT